MHMLGEPRTMQEDPRYDDVVSEVKAFLEERLAFAVGAGIAEERDLPRPRHRLRQDASSTTSSSSARLDELRRARPAGAWSASRASAFSAGSSAATAPRRGAAGVAVAVLAYERGATIFRVHDVREHVEALAVARALEEVSS